MSATDGELRGRLVIPQSGKPGFMSVSHLDEAEMRHLNETLEQRVAARTRELADANLKLVAESIERRRMDTRMQKLQLELYHAARFSEAGQMAAALAHEINQPLTAAAHSASAGRRLLATGEPRQLGNVSQACKMLGYSRDSFYRFK